MSQSTETYFERPQGDTFVARAPSRGPWSADHCHAGPVAGLIARAAEQLFPEQVLTRLTIDLIRPVAMAGFKVNAQISRQGRTVSTGTVQLHGLDGKLCASATTSHLANIEFPGVPGLAGAPIERGDASDGTFPIRKTAHDLPCFPDFVEVLYPPGETLEPGPTCLWMRTPGLIPGETPSPFQRLCPLADCGNALSRNAELQEVTFVNTDLTIVAHRLPRGTWLASSSRSHWHSTGVGLSVAELSDEHGPVASALQTLVLRPGQSSG